MQYAGVAHIYLYDNYKVPSEKLETWLTDTFQAGDVTYVDYSQFQ
jgi:hypothetical protein